MEDLKVLLNIFITFTSVIGILFIMNYFKLIFKIKKYILLKNKQILFISGEGCQAYHEFKWIGKVIGFNGDNAKIKIYIHNHHYNDIRDEDFKEEIREWPLYQIQNVNGILVIFN